MKTPTLTFLFSTAILLHPTFAEGENDQKERKHGPRVDPITKYDTNDDGVLSLEEFSLSRKISHLEEDQIKALFNRIDKNSDQVIDQEEISVVKKPRPEGGPHRLAKYDTNGDRRVSLEEFLVDKSPEETERYEKIFQMLDRNQDDFLSREDREERGGRGHKHPMHKEHRNRMIEKLDTDGDNAVSLEEFKESDRHQDEHIEAIFNRLDSDGNGLIDANDHPPKRPKH